MPPGTLFFLEKAGKELLRRRLCKRLAHVRAAVR